MTGSIKTIIFESDDTLLDRHVAQIRVTGHLAERFSHIFRGISHGHIEAALPQSDLLATADFYAEGSVGAMTAYNRERIQQWRLPHNELTPDSSLDNLAPKEYFEVKEARENPAVARTVFR